MNLSMKLFAGVAAVAVLCTLHSVARANLLYNPSFEVPPDNPGPFGEVADGWDQFTFTSTGTQDGSMPHSGDYSISFSGGSSTTGSTGAYQRVLGVVPLTPYSFSVWAKADALPISTDDANGGAGIRIEWHANSDGTSSSLAMDNLLPIGALLTTDYQQFTVNGIAPAGAGHLRAVMLHRHNDRTVFYDDAEVLGAQVPEPSSLALLVVSAAGVALMGGKRRVR